MCPRCGKLVGLDRVCPYCGADTGSVGARVQRLSAGARGGGHAVTIGLVLANVLVYLLIVMIGGQQPAQGGLEIMTPDGDTLIRLGLHVPPLVAEGEWWRLVMPVFLHLGLLHIVMNTLVLWVTGRHLEADIGSAAFFFMYIAAGVLGFALSQIAGLGGGGASGAVAGILGCTIVKRRISDGNFRHPVTQQAIQLVVLNAIFGLAVARVNNVAHLGGLLTGAGLGIAYGLWERKAWAPRVWLAGALAMGALVVAAVVSMLTWEAPPGLLDRSSRRARAQEVIRCVQPLAATLDKRATIDPPEASEAMRCLDRAGPVEPDLDRAVAVLRSGLARSRDALMTGSVGGDREGMARINEGLEGIVRWIQAENGGEDR